MPNKTDDPYKRKTKKDKKKWKQQNYGKYTQKHVRLITLQKINK